MISVDLCQHHGSATEIILIIIGHFKTADQESTISARPIEKSTEQMLSAHWYQPMSEFALSPDIKQCEDPSMIIAGRIPKE